MPLPFGVYVQCPHCGAADGVEIDPAHPFAVFACPKCRQIYSVAIAFDVRKFPHTERNPADVPPVVLRIAR